jgi:hypothetical protein
MVVLLHPLDELLLLEVIPALLVSLHKHLVNLALLDSS